MKSEHKLALGVIITLAVMMVMGFAAMVGAERAKFAAVSDVANAVECITGAREGK